MTNLAADPLSEFQVPWRVVRDSDVTAYMQVLNSAPDERPLQKHLQANPFLLSQHLSGGNGRWVIPQARLGSQFIPDFVLAERHSMGKEWTLVELQSPCAEFFTRAGRQREQLDEGIRQILEWRRWLSANRDYARRSRVENGLGLDGIDDKANALLLIGRERSLTVNDSERLRQLGHDHRMTIHTYDWLVRETTARIAEHSSSTED